MTPGETEASQPQVATSGSPPGPAGTAQSEVTRRYDRIASVYDVLQAPMDWLGGRRRKRRVLARASGRVLEVGIGTGSSLTLYGPEVDVTGIDVSNRMLARARAKAARLGSHADLQQGDVQALPFPDASFDTVTATCVFCSVADPVRGLTEVARVVRPDGQVLLLEHVRPRNRVLGWLADRLTPLVRRLVGPEINRRTEDNIAAAGLDIVEIRRSGVWREIVATRQSTG